MIIWIIFSFGFSLPKDLAERDTAGVVSAFVAMRLGPRVVVLAFFS